LGEEEAHPTITGQDRIDWIMAKDITMPQNPVNPVHPIDKKIPEEFCRIDGFASFNPSWRDQVYNQIP